MLNRNKTLTLSVHYAAGKGGLAAKIECAPLMWQGAFGDWIAAIGFPKLCQNFQCIVPNSIAATRATAPNTPAKTKNAKPIA